MQYYIHSQAIHMQLRPHQQRAFDSMESATAGQIYCPTGGGKTYIMIADLMRRLRQVDKPSVFVVVAPRILLANQLQSEFCEFITDAQIAHVHSGETAHFSSTKPAEIRSCVTLWQVNQKHTMIFTTYHSLGRVVDSGVDIDTIYFDEAHNATGRHFFKSVFAVSQYATRRFFVTATPKHDRSTGYKRGMNNTDVFGGVLESTAAPELISSGSIVPPVVVPYETDEIRTKENAPMLDADNILGILDRLDDDKSQKVLVAAPNTRVLWRMLSESYVLEEIKQRGYDVMHITSKHGAYVNQTKVTREQFFETLDDWGRDKSRKFIVFHYSILSEGINVPGLSHCILLRNLPTIEMAQTIGRVIRTDRDDVAAMRDGSLQPGVFANYNKPCGYVTVPMTSGYGAGVRTAKRLQSLVDTIFIKGVPAIAFC